MVLLTVMGMCACTISNMKEAKVADESETSREETIDMKGKKVLVAYFSWSGNTREAAQYIAKKTGADEFEIIRRERWRTWRSMMWYSSVSPYGGTRHRCPCSRSWNSTI